MSTGSGYRKIHFAHFNSSPDVAVWSGKSGFFAPPLGPPVENCVCQKVAKFFGAAGSFVGYAFSRYDEPPCKNPLLPLLVSGISWIWQGSDESGFLRRGWGCSRKLCPSIHCFQAGMTINSIRLQFCISGRNLDGRQDDETSDGEMWLCHGE